MEERLEALKEEKERLLNSVVEAEYVLKCNRDSPFCLEMNGFIRGIYLATLFRLLTNIALGMRLHNFHFSSKRFIHMYCVTTIEVVIVSFVAEELLSCS